MQIKYPTTQHHQTGAARYTARRMAPKRGAGQRPGAKADAKAASQGSSAATAAAAGASAGVSMKKAVNLSLDAEAHVKRLLTVRWRGVKEEGGDRAEEGNPHGHGIAWTGCTAKLPMTAAT